MQRCHIIPDSLGGKDEPSNIVLLCGRCHEDGPNVSDPEIMWDWIKAYRVPFYETFWQIQGMKEYEFIYKKKLEDEIKYILLEANVELDESTQAAISQVLFSMQGEVSVHFGETYLNTATLAGVCRMMLKKLAKKYGVVFPRIEENSVI